MMMSMNKQLVFSTNIHTEYPMNIESNTIQGLAIFTLNYIVIVVNFSGTSPRARQPGL